MPKSCKCPLSRCSKMACPKKCQLRGGRYCRVVVTTVIILIFIAIALGVTMAILRMEKSSMEEVNKEEQTQGELQSNYWPQPAPPQDPRDKLYLISVGDDFGGIESRGERGELIGMGRLLIPLVCEEAGIRCAVVYSAYTDCWESGQNGSSPAGGRGLLGKWFDSCFGWFVTLQRIHVLSFGKSHLQREKAFFFHKRETDFDSYNIIGKKIGFIQAWAMNVDCIRSRKNIAGANIPSKNIKHYATNKDGIDAVKRGEIDALFAAWNGVQKLLKPNNIVHSNQVINCLLEGSAVMSRKDSDFPALWNVGIDKARSSGKFRRLCRSARIQFLHLGSFSCIDEDVV